jgi:hypothetical protein
MHRLLFIPVSLLLIAGAGLGAAEGAEAPADPPLMEEMEAINRAFKTIRRNLAKPDKRADVLAAVDIMLTGSTAAKAHQPAMIATLPAAEQAAAKQDYTERMEQVVVQLTALKAAIEANDTAKAEALIDSLRSAKDEGHERYIPDEE